MSPGPYCIIGAGAAGLGTAKAFKQAGLPFEVLESADDIGGLWDVSRPDSPLSRNTHTIASKTLQVYPDFPVPDDYPDYPSHEQVLQYLRSYADAHDLLPHITFGAPVKGVEPTETGAGVAGWCVTLEDGTRREYAGVVIATGHDRVPRMIELPGSPAVPVLHSRDYSGPAQVAGKRVLVVGAGQSAADLLADCAVTAERTVHSSRRGFFCMPKYLLGRPTDTMLQGPLPPRLRRLSYQLLFRYLRRRSRALGIPVPDFSAGLVIPILGDLLHHHYNHGDIVFKPGISSIEGDRVVFADDSEVQVDVIFLATGFLPSYPVVDRKLLDWSDDSLKPSLYLNIFPPQADDLFIVGMVRPIGSHWDVYEMQGRLVAAALLARTGDPRRAARFDRVRRGPQPDLQAGLRLYNSEQYPLVVEKQEYLHQVRRHLKLLNASAR